MSTPTAITVTLDGTEYPADKVCWVQVAPCGCIGGITSCYRPSTGRFYESGPYLTHAQLEQHFIETGYSRDTLAREREQGFVWELREWDAAHEAAQTPCPHTPKWGVEPRPEIEGYMWAPSTKGRRLHLVPERRIGTYQLGKSLCGQTGRWVEPDIWTRGMPECKRCLSKVGSEPTM